MVQYTKILVASAVAAAVPALAAPFPAFESREIENIDAREPVFGAIKKVVSDGASRRVTVTNPIKNIANNAVKSNNAQQRQTPHRGPLLKAAVGSQQKASSSRRKRNLEDLSERDSFDDGDLDAREPLFSAFKKVVTDGASRRVTVNNPIKNVANNAMKSNNAQQRQTPHRGPLLKAAVGAQQKASSSRRKRDLEDLLERDSFDADAGDIDAREPLFSAFSKVVTNGASRRVTVNNPIKNVANNAMKSNNAQQRQTPHRGPLLKAAVGAQQKASSSRRKRDLEDLLERDSFDADAVDIDAREPLFSAFKKVVTDGASRRVTVNNPIKNVANNAVKSNDAQKKQTPHRGPALKAAVTAQQNLKKAQQNQKQAQPKFSQPKAPQPKASSSRRKRDLEDLLERDSFDLD